MFSRLPSHYSQWKIPLASLIALALTIPLLPTQSTHPLSQSFAPNVANISTAMDTSRNWSGYTATGGSFTSVAWKQWNEFLRHILLIGFWPMNALKMQAIKHWHSLACRQGICRNLVALFNEGIFPIKVLDNF
jgi:hypothetical protein